MWRTELLYRDSGFELAIWSNRLGGWLCEWRTRSGQPVHVTDNGEPLWIIQAFGAASQDPVGDQEIDGMLDGSSGYRHHARAQGRSGSAREVLGSAGLPGDHVEPRSRLDRARQLSEKHTKRLGCQGFDLLHVALALELRADDFLTSDRAQGNLAHAECLTVTFATNDLPERPNYQQRAVHGGTKS